MFLLVCLLFPFSLYFFFFLFFLFAKKINELDFFDGYRGNMVMKGIGYGVVR